MIKLYGISNCDSVKKARKWLDNKNLEYEFHDYKKLGVPEKNLKQWVKKFGWETVLNKRSTTWKKLDDKTRQNLNEHSAIRIMLENPSSIKRPVLIDNNKLIIGFKEAEYQSLI